MSCRRPDWALLAAIGPEGFCKLSVGLRKSRQEIAPDAIGRLGAGSSQTASGAALP